MNECLSKLHVPDIETVAVISYDEDRLTNKYQK